MYGYIGLMVGGLCLRVSGLATLCALDTQKVWSPNPHTEDPIPIVGLYPKP